MPAVFTPLGGNSEQLQLIFGAVEAGGRSAAVHEAAEAVMPLIGRKAA